MANHVGQPEIFGSGNI